MDGGDWNRLSVQREELFRRFPPLGPIPDDPIASYWARGEDDRLLQVHLLSRQDPEGQRLVGLVGLIRERSQDDLLEVVELAGETAVVTKALPAGVVFHEWLESEAGSLAGPSESGEMSRAENGSDYSAVFRAPEAPVTPDTPSADPPGVVPNGAPPTQTHAVPLEPPPPPPITVDPASGEPAAGAHEPAPPAGPGRSDYTAFFEVPALGEVLGEKDQEPPPVPPPPPAAGPPAPPPVPPPPPAAGPSPPPPVAGPPPPPPPPPLRDPVPPPATGPDYTREFGVARTRPENEPRRPPGPETPPRSGERPGAPVERGHVSPPMGFPKLPEDLAARTGAEREHHGRDPEERDSDSITVEFRRPRTTPQPEPGAPRDRGWSASQEGRAPSALPLRDYLGKLERQGEAQPEGREPSQPPPPWKAAPPPMRPPMPRGSEPTVVSPLRPPEMPRQSQASGAPPHPPPAGGKGGQGGLRTRDVVILVSVILVVLLVAAGAVLYLFLRGD